MADTLKTAARSEVFIREVLDLPIGQTKGYLVAWKGRLVESPSSRSSLPESKLYNGFAYNSVVVENVFTQ